MELMMCLSCGEFVPALKEGGEFVPRTEECPECGETEFKHNETGRRVRADD